MAQRQIVSAVNVDALKKKVKNNGWSNAYFCETLMGKTRGWFSEWVRKDKCGNVTPKNLPSPEEAAKMCLLLNTTPEEILIEPADIELVKGLIEQERERQGIKKEAPGAAEGLSDKDIQFVKWFRSLSPEKQKAILIAQDGPVDLAD